MRKQFGQKAVVLGLTVCMALGGAVGLAEDGLAGAAVLEGMGLDSAVLDIGERMAEAESMTVDAQLAVRQNGEDVITGDVLFQYGEDSQYTMTSITHGGETREREQSSADDTSVMRVDDEYYVITSEKDESENVGSGWKGRSGRTMSDSLSVPEDTTGYLSTVMQQLFGEVTDKMTVTDDGFSLHLAGDEVPAILNLALSMADVQMTPSYSYMRGTRGEVGAVEETDVDALSLGTQVRITSIDMDVALDGDYISGIQCSIMLTGQDADGETLETEFAAVVRVADVNATTPAVVDTDGVGLKPVDSSHGMQMRMPGQSTTTRRGK